MVCMLVASAPSQWLALMISGPAMPGKIVSPGGVKSAGPDPVTGYCIFQAGDLDSVVKMSKSCPIIPAGGQVAVYPIMAML